MDVGQYNEVVVPFTRQHPTTDAQAVSLLLGMLEKLPDLDVDEIMVTNMFQRERQCGRNVRTSYLNTIDELTQEDDW